MLNRKKAVRYGAVAAAALAIAGASAYFGLRPNAPSDVIEANGQVFFRACRSLQARAFNQLSKDDL